MEDKQKQIEEMAKNCSNCLHYEVCSLWTTTDLDEDEAYKYCFGRYKSKLTEDMVMLKKEELQENYVSKTLYEQLQKVSLTRKEQIDKLCQKLMETRKETAEKISSSIEDILKEPYKGKTEKQEWQRKGMEEGLRMALEICNEITGEIYERF